MSSDWEEIDRLVREVARGHGFDCLDIIEQTTFVFRVPGLREQYGPHDEALRQDILIVLLCIRGHSDGLSCGPRRIGSVLRMLMGGFSMDSTAALLGEESGTVAAVLRWIYKNL